MQVFREANGRKQLSLGAIFKHLFKIFEDASAPSSAPFSSENENNKKESLGNSLQLLGFYWSGR